MVLTDTMTAGEHHHVQFPEAALTLNDKRYPFSRLIRSVGADFPGTLTPQERYTLQFCHQWLTGQEIFSLQTSGSTGKPKTITLNREQMITSARLTGQCLGLQPGDRTLVCLPSNYIAGMMMLVRGFELGLSLTVITPTSNPLAEFDDATRFEFTALTPLQLWEIVTVGSAKVSILNRMKAILVGGAPMNSALLQKIRALLKVPVYHTYGMTETASHIALRPLNDSQASDFFTPLEGIEIGLDPRNCLTVTSAVTRHRTLVTNDRIELRPDGSFRWLGRIDNVINSGGIKVQAEKVESALESLFQYYQGGILAERRVVVGPFDHPRLGQAVMALIEGSPLSAEIQASIRAKLMAEKLLQRYEVPRGFHFLPRLLTTKTGKLDRRANLANIAEMKP